MLDLLWLAATPTPSMTVNPDDVTPGVIGFAAIGVAAVLVIFLAIDMLRRIRRAQYRVDVNEQLDAEERAAAEGHEPGDGTSREDRAKD